MLYNTNIDYINVGSNEMKFVTDRDTITVLATFDIGTDIVITCHNPATKKTGLARTENFDELHKFIKSIVECEFTAPEPIIQIRLIGGDNSEKSKQWVRHIIQILDNVDNERNIINIISADINDKPHPKSFKITSLDGKVGEIEATHS